MNDRKKINCLEGFRAIGWISVFLCHFFASFYPDIQTIFFKIPISIYNLGSVWVRIFFVISGLVISLKYFNKEISFDEIINDIIRRYFRLMPSIFISVFFAYILMKLGFYKNLEAGKITQAQSFLEQFNNFEPKILNVFKESFFKVYLKSGSTYIAPLWTISYEFLGSILTIITVLVLRHSNKRYLFYFLFFVFYKNFFVYFILGMLICDLILNEKINITLKKMNFLYPLIIIIGFTTTALSIFGINDVFSENKNSRIIFGIGLVFLLYGCINFKIMEQILGNRIMKFFGKISFSAYLIHWPVIETFSFSILLYFNGKIDYSYLSKIILFLTILVITALSILMTFFIEYLQKNYINKTVLKNIPTNC